MSCPGRSSSGQTFDLGFIPSLSMVLCDRYGGVTILMSKSLKGYQLRQHLAQIRRWSLFIVLCTVFAALGGFVVSKIQRPNYEATAILVVDQQALGSNSGATTIDELVTTYVNLIPQRVVLERAVSGINGVSAT